MVLARPQREKKKALPFAPQFVPTPFPRPSPYSLVCCMVINISLEWCSCSEDGDEGARVGVRARLLYNRRFLDFRSRVLGGGYRAVGCCGTVECRRHRQSCHRQRVRRLTTTCPQRVPPGRLSKRDIAFSLHMATFQGQGSHGSRWLLSAALYGCRFLSTAEGCKL